MTITPCTAYLSGAMSIYRDTDWGYGNFNAAAADLRSRGWRIFNPAESFGGDPGAGDFATYIEIDLVAVKVCEAIIVLPDWEQSEGAMLEVRTAEIHGRPLFLYAPDEPLGVRPMRATAKRAVTMTATATATDATATEAA